MKDLEIIKDRLSVSPRILLIYIILYYSWGFCMNEFGMLTEIARFKFRFQIFTCYVLYMIPVSLLLRKLPWHAQFAYGAIMMGILEFGGYALQTSIAYDNNPIDRMFGVRNFSLTMTLFFASYFPLGNAVVKAISGWFNLRFS